VDMSTPLLPEGVPEIDADSLSLVYIRVIWHRVGHIMRYTIACYNASDIEMDKFCVCMWPVVHMTGKFQTVVHVNQFR